MYFMFQKIISKVRNIVANIVPIKANAGKISTTELVNRVFNFCEVYSGRIMYPYQAQFSKRIIRSVLENDGAELTALFSRQSGKTETVAVTVGGLMIILPQLANMPMFLEDSRLQPFKDGFWVGIFAPSQRQAQTTYNRMRGRMMCKEAQAVLNDPDFRLEFTTSNGQTVALSNGSFCTAISASDGSNIEGESFKFIICEECFVKGTPILTKNGYANIEDVKVGDEVYSFNHETKSVELKVVERSFSQPLFGRKIVTIHTDSGKKIVCTDNHKIFIPRLDSYVRADSLRIGDLMLSYMQNTQGSEVLYNDNESDGTWNTNGRRVHTISRQKVFQKSKVSNKPFGQAERICNGQVQKGRRTMCKSSEVTKELRERKHSLSIYNKMFARNENVLQPVLSEWEESVVEKHPKFNDTRSTSLLVSRRREHEGNDVYTYPMLHDGREQITSNLVEREFWNRSENKDRQTNKQTISVLYGDREKQVSQVNTSLCNTFNAVQDTHNRCGDTLCNLWENDITLPSKESGILFRGMSKDTQSGVYEKLLHEEKIVSIEINEVEEIEVFDLTVADNHNFFANGLLVHNCQDISNYKIQKSIHPMGAAYNSTICKIGTATTFKGDFYEAINRNKKDYESGKLPIKNHFEYNYKVVEKYNPKYKKYVDREKRSLGENSDAFRMSYNLEWIISRGMFVDIRKVEKECGDEYLDTVMQDYTATHCVGIDIGGGSSKSKEADSTIITVVEVDWDYPVLMESSVDEETHEDIVYMAYNTYIKNWCEITPEQAEDYEEQYHIIMDFLKNYKVARLVIDATREASLGQRIKANVSYEVVLFTFSAKSKSEIYKHLQTEINTGRARFPRSQSVVESKEYQKFTQQLADLQKGYSGSNLVVSHPDERGAHDDYPDSWALAVWATKDKGYADNTETHNRNRVMSGFNRPSIFRSRNRKTARRR